MLRLVLVVTFTVFLSQFPCEAADNTQPDTPIQLADAGGQQSTESMKQSDYRNRIAREQEEKERDKEVAGIGLAETESRGLDNFVMVLLVISAGALIFLSARIRGKTRGGGGSQRLPLR